MDTKVRDIMTPDPVGVYYEQTVAEAAKVMRDAGVGAVLVVSGESLSGMVTDRDLVIRGLADGAGPDSPVGPLCSEKLVGVDANADLADAEKLIREHAVRRLPVIDSGQIVGMVSLADLAASAEPESLLAAVSSARANA